MPKACRNRHRQNQVLLQQPEFEAGQSVARVVQACGENIYEVEIDGGERCLYQLPKRLRHVAFIRRGCYVFVRNDATRGPGKICGDVEAVVLNRFINELRKEPFWPSYFKNTPQRLDRPNDGSDDETGASNLHIQNYNEDKPAQKVRENEEDEEDSSNEDEFEWQIGMGNPNRGKWDHLPDSESDVESPDC